MNLKQVLRCSHVKRWGIVNVSRPQNLAEHSFNVCQIAGHLARAFNWTGLLHNGDALALAQWALNHDTIEVITGDIPTPFKSTLRELGVNLNAIERSENEAYGSLAASVAGTVIEDIVKMADVMESIHFLKDHGVGQHASEVLAGLHLQLYLLVGEISKRRPELAVYDGYHKVMKEMGL